MSEAFVRTRGGFEISTDPARLDVAVVHAELARTYWAEGIPRELVERSIANSMCFGLYGPGQEQLGFARVVTDRATFAYLCDVWVLEERRAAGLGTWLVETVLSHPELQSLRRFVLVTRDAHALYARLGFRPLAAPEGYMEIARPGLYTLGQR